MDTQTAELSPTMGWILLAIFSVGWIALGIFWGRKAKNLDGFMLAGRNVGLALGAATAMATWVTSNTIMVAPQFGYRMGIWGMLGYASAAFGLFLFAPLAFRIRRLMPKGFTSGDFIRLRYGPSAWAIFLAISLFYSVIWLITMATAGGELLNSLSGLDYHIGMSVIIFVCVVYTLFGGLFAVIGTDFIQSVIILLGVVAVGIAIMLSIDMPEAHDTIATRQPELLNAMMPVALLSFFNVMFFGWGEIMHNNVWWSRAFAMREGVSHKAFALAGLFWLPIPIAAGFIGMMALPLGINVPDLNQVGPMVASKVLGGVGSVAVFIVVFCSIASSIDSLLAATSDLINEDIYRKIFHPTASEKVLRYTGSACIILLGLIAWGVGLTRQNLLNLLYMAGPFVGSTIWPVMCGLLWRNTNRYAAVLGMVLGCILGWLTYEFVAWYVATLVGTAVSMVITVVGTWIFPEKFDWSILDEDHLNETEEADAVGS
jgi:Na+/proline symporter